MYQPETMLLEHSCRGLSYVRLKCSQTQQARIASTTLTCSSVACMDEACLCRAGRWTCGMRPTLASERGIWMYTVFGENDSTPLPHILSVPGNHVTTPDFVIVSVKISPRVTQRPPVSPPCLHFNLDWECVGYSHRPQGRLGLVMTFAFSKHRRGRASG